jgi:hypothetical protein
MSPSLRKCLLFCVVCLPLSLARARADDAVDEAQQAIIRLYDDNQLFNKGKYKTVRAAFARLFQAKHRAALEKAFGEDAGALGKWLDEHPDLKEELYNAIDERFDKIGPALSLFHTLWKKFPAQLAKNPELGIAVAVTWDDPRGVYNYRGHQIRTKSTLPASLVDGPANFEYLLTHDKATATRCRYLPWEFLVFVVDHPTPLVERGWAQTYFKTNRGLKSWHQDVPYDRGMLKAEMNKGKGGTAPEPQLKDREYTLSNLRKYGGVCAQQADFAARVAKSVGVPAVYCTGESAYRSGGHAWCMYVKVHKATPASLQFTVSSDGRYIGFIKDAFYTGKVRDPQTGQQVLDRDLERRLYLAGSNRVGKRQVALLMRAYPWLQEKLNWDVGKRVAFLDKALRLCPMSEEPWLEFARLVKSNELQAAQKGVVRSHISEVLKQFDKHPDFVQRVFNDLLSLHEPAEQVKLYQQAVALFERSRRPDLACEARLHITDALARGKKWQAAGEGLFTTIYRFPTEGRYVPKLLLKAQEVCPQYKGGKERLAKVYLDLVPKLVTYYKEEKHYPDQVYQQALAFFTTNQLTKQAAELKARVGSR